MRLAAPRARSCLLGLIALAAIDGCATSSAQSTSRTSARHGGASTCAPPYVFRWPGHTVDAGSCAAIVEAPRATVVLREGQQLRLQILLDGTRDGFPVPTPSTSVLKLAGRRPGIANYRAIRAGNTQLRATTRFCNAASDRRRSCLVLRVRVT